MKIKHKDFDWWRENYDTMSYEEFKAFRKKVGEALPVQEQLIVELYSK